MSKQLEVFLSYGHTETGSNVLPLVVEWLKEKLIERKHSVFIDIEKLPRAEYTNWPNSSWRSTIFNNIDNCDSVLGVLSERGLRENGVCLDELSIAVSNPGRNIVTVLLESQAVLKIPPTISRIQWVDMSDWQEYYNGNFENDYFNNKFSEIIKRIESKDNFLYQADINFLMRALNPSNTVKTSLFDLLKKESNKEGMYIYEDRTWLKDIFTSFISSDDKHYLLFSGGAGYGKSQFIAHCIHYFADVCAYFFIKYDKAKRDCNLFLRTLAFELAAKLPDYRSNLISAIKGYPCYNAAALEEVLNFFRELNDSELFDSLFHCDKINTIYGGGKIVICIDALDEAEIIEDGGKITNPIIDLLISKHSLWPKGFCFVLTSRDESDIINRLEVLGNDIEFVSLRNDQSDDDISKYLTNRLVETKRVKETYVKELVITCEKTFIYADLLVKSVEDGTITISSENDLNNLPKGYKGLLLKYFERLFSDGGYSSVRKPLGLMVANNGSLSISVMDEMMRFDDENWDHVLFVNRMKSFVVKKDNSFAFYHKSINDWIVSDQASRFHLCLEDYKSHIVEFDKAFIENFEKMKNLYADATGFELLDDASENGYTYEIVKYVYESYMKFAKKIESRKLKYNHVAFVALVIYQAYKNSDLYFAKKVFETVKSVADDFKNLNASDKFYVALTYAVMSEIEIARGNEVPENYVEDKSSIDAFNCKYGIEYLYFIKNVFPELSNYPGLYCSVVDNIAFVMRLWKSQREEALDILENLKKYIDKGDYIGKSCTYAHMYYHKAVILYVLSKPEEAIEALEQSLKYIEIYEQEIGESYFFRKMRCLVYNQFGACYNRIAQQLSLKIREGNCAIGDSEKMQDYFTKSISYAEESLKVRIEEYGKMSFYVATAYDNYARWKKNFETAQPDFRKISTDVYEAVNNAIYIKEYIFSDTGKVTARSYMTMAFCFADDEEFEKAIEYGQKACDIDPETYSGQFREIAKKISK